MMVRIWSKRSVSNESLGVEFLVKHCKYITSLALQRSSLTDKSISIIAKELESQLVYLEISSSHVTDTGISALNKCPNIRLLDLEGCSNITEKGFYY